MKEMELEKYKGFQAALAVAETFEEIKSIESKAAVLAELAKRNKYGFDEQNEWGLFRVEIEAKKGKWLDEHFPNGAKKGFNNREIVESNKTTLQTEGITKDESSNARVINNEPELRKQVIEAVIKSGKVITPKIVGNEIKKIVKGQTLTDKKAEYVLQSSADILIKPDVFLMDSKKFLKTFPDNSIDLLLTDPPYSTHVADINAFTKSWLLLAIQKTKKSGRMLIFSGAYPEEIQAFLKVLLKQTKFILAPPLIWSYKNTLAKTPKMHHNLNYQLIWELYSKESSPLDTSITGEMFSVMEMNAPDGRLGKRFHAWQKPDELARRLIRHTTKEGDLVVDPFVCTGTFVLEANRLKRRGKGCDNNQANLDIAISRGCQLINHIDVPEATEDDVANSTIIFKADLPSTEQNKTHDSVGQNGKEKGDGLLELDGDIIKKEIDNGSNSDRIDDYSAGIPPLSKSGYTMPVSENINFHNSTRRKTKVTVQSKD